MYLHYEVQSFVCCLVTPHPAGLLILRGCDDGGNLFSDYRKHQGSMTVCLRTVHLTRASGGLPPGGGGKQPLPPTRCGGERCAWVMAVEFHPLRHRQGRHTQPSGPLESAKIPHPAASTFSIRAASHLCGNRHRTSHQTANSPKLSVPFKSRKDFSASSKAADRNRTRIRRVQTACSAN